MRAVDLFAGWGGFSLGAERAGVDVLWAANHWRTAVDVHRQNHPATVHECQDLRQANWTTLPAFDILIASPACQGHSEAGQPNAARWGSHVLRKHDSDRSTAWAVVDCAEITRPRALIVENVPAFRRWRLFGVWKTAIETLGYTLTESILSASAFGTPQRRERFFLVGTLGGGRPTFRPHASEPAFGPCVDWSSGDWRPVASCTSSNARERLAKGRRNHGPRFLSQHVTGHPGVPLDEPIRTITTKDQWCVVDGDRYRSLTTREYARGMGFPDHFTWPADLPRVTVVRGLGNAVPPPLAAAVVEATIAAEWRESRCAAS